MAPPPALNLVVWFLYVITQNRSHADIGLNISITFNQECKRAQPMSSVERKWIAVKGKRIGTAKVDAVGAIGKIFNNWAAL